MGGRVERTARSSPSSRHLRWENFEARILKGPPSLEPISGSPRVHLFIEANGRRIGARFFCRRGQVVPSPLAEVPVREVGIGSGTCLEVSTGNAALYRDFYALCCVIADRVQIAKQPVGTAIQQTLSSWASLVRRKSLLSREEQIGLVGELLFMERAAKSLGWSVVSQSWFGPKTEEHDFVLPAADIEVKTTTREQRVHKIASLTQLLPKERRRLQLVSIQLTAGGENKDAISLPETVASVLSAAGRADAAAADAIRDQLLRMGWADQDAPHYADRYYRRAPLVTIHVTGNFPAIVPHTLASLGRESASRIEGVSYSVNVDGLGVADGKPGFEHALFKE